MRRHVATHASAERSPTCATNDGNTLPAVEGDCEPVQCRVQLRAIAEHDICEDDVTVGWPRAWRLGIGHDERLLLRQGVTVLDDAFHRAHASFRLRSVQA